MFGFRGKVVVPVFIGGTGRSGTTILGDLLNEHSRVRTSNPTEIKFLANRGGFLDAKALVNSFAVESNRG